MVAENAIIKAGKSVQEIRQDKVTRQCKRIWMHIWAAKTTPRSLTHSRGCGTNTVIEVGHRSIHECVTATENGYDGRRLENFPHKGNTAVGVF